ncbi:hypothetical protein [Streptomyces fulvoviolaceus]|uniref:hypothetical protein n=1 Tax=Streptomyces fulvoviolaceus TaxID=285535 RepID=UPI0006945E65|nr:hypothetical protein [Streptomyces fulvoviolaceus]
MKFRTENRTRSAPKTIDGVTHLVDEVHKVQVGIPPKDRDAQAVKAVTALAVFILTGAIVWSTVAIGALLSTAFNPVISYGIAAVFDAAWIGCLTLEWIARYDSERSALPRWAGWGALVLSMTLIAAHGSLSGNLWIGIAGAGVSLVAKGFWAIMMRTTEARLDPATAGWVRAERSVVDGQRAMVAVQRQLQRSRALAMDEAQALSGSGELTGVTWGTDDRGGLTPERLSEALREEITTASAPEPTESGSERSSPERSERHERLRELLVDQPNLTGPQAAQLLKVSPATAKRDLSAVRVNGSGS